MQEIYTATERHLIEGVKLLEQALETKKKVNALLELDTQLLDMEQEQGNMDGIALQEWLL